MGQYFNLEYDDCGSMSSTYGSTKSLNSINYDDSDFSTNLAKYNSLTSFILMSFSVLPSLICEFGVEKTEKSPTISARAKAIKSTALYYNTKTKNFNKTRH